MISPAQKQHVIDLTRETVSIAAAHYGIVLPHIPVLFDLAGRAAGMYRVRGQQRMIRYNPHIFARYYNDNLANTIPHEVAHYVADMIYGLHRIKPHGEEWKHVMQSLGVRAEVTCRYDTSGLPQRRQQRFDYQCDCTTHRLTAVRHNRLHHGRANYVCKQCGSRLRPNQDSATSTAR